MKPRYLAPIGVIVLLFLARLYLAAPGSSPVGQPQLAELTELDAIKREFNHNVAKTRVVVLVSPSCPYCLKGASVIASIFDAHRDRPLSIFVVWQPIQPTDWGQPGTGALGRIPDQRARQDRDAKHLVARALQQSFEQRDPQPNCCYYKDIWWDMLAVFPPGVEWRERLPEPLVLEGTVEEAAPSFEDLLRK